MSMPPDDRSFRREMAAAYRSGWHFIDLVSAVPEGDEPLTVTLFGEPILVVRDEEDGVRAYRALRHPLRHGLRQPRPARPPPGRDRTSHSHPPQRLRRDPPVVTDRPGAPPGSDATVDLNTVASLSLCGGLHGCDAAVRQGGPERTGGHAGRGRFPMARVTAISMTTRAGFSRGSRP
ncbi:hypothetical protein Srut_13320 [Streptomyces rutgersensis]|nr:hypothetical protein Srut_13320 [Streptomyces rutgersensis]